MSILRSLIFKRALTAVQRRSVGYLPLSEEAMSRVLVTKDEDNGEDTGVRIITFNHPDKMNALNEDLGDVLQRRVYDLRHDRTLRAVVLTGTGSAFSAGGDLGFLSDRARTEAVDNNEVMLHFYRRFLTIRTLPVPVVVAINGHALGAGMSLASAADMRLITKKAKIGMTFVSIGLHPGMGSTHFLRQVVGDQQAYRLLFTGDVISGEEAAKIGFALEAVEPNELMPKALTIARKIARQSPVAIRLLTQTMRARQDEGLGTALLREASTQADCYGSADLLEGVRAIIEKRKPNFSRGH